jgi:hypothetical protein
MLVIAAFLLPELAVAFSGRWLIGRSGVRAGERPACEGDRPGPTSPFVESAA